MNTVSWGGYLSGALDGETPLAVSIGIFDGVHRGHMALLRRITAAPGMTPVVITFDPSPRLMCHSRTCSENLTGYKVQTFGTSPKVTGPVILTSLAEKAALLEAAGAAALVVIDFSPGFSALSGKEFVRLLCEGRRVGLVAVGGNFRCGAGRDTDAQGLKALTAAYGVTTEIIPAVMDGGLAVSSSRIREAAARGDVLTAERLLGRPFDLSRITPFTKE